MKNFLCFPIFWEKNPIFGQKSGSLGKKLVFLQKIFDFFGKKSA
jgi:hypothetical protein